MSEAIAQTWEQELVARGKARGLRRAHREDLRGLLEERFGLQPETLAERIGATNDQERLRGGVRQIMRIQSLDELDL